LWTPLNAAKSNANVFSNIKTNKDKVSDKCICIRDKIVSINGNPCHDKSFDYVVDLISKSDTDKITLEIGRIDGHTVVNYDDGVCISAKPVENYGFLAKKCNVHIDYECRSGSCQTCMKVLEFPNKRNVKGEWEEMSIAGNEKDTSESASIHSRFIFHCVGKVPRGYDWLHVLRGSSALRWQEDMKNK